MPARIVVTHSTAMDEASAARELAAKLRQQAGGSPVRGGLVYCTVGVRTPALQKALVEQLPGVPFIGATSCVGVGSAEGFRTERIVSALWLVGDGFRFGVSALSRGGDVRGQGRELANDALKSGLIPAEAARFAVVHATPGSEESLLAGLYDVLPRRTVLVGGSAADNDISGQWSVWSSEGVHTTGAVLAVCDWPWRLTAMCQGGYLVTRHRGTVTRASGRTVYTIDGRPAADVYNEWLDGKLKSFLETGGTVLSSTTLCPLGVPRTMDGLETHVVVHPEKVLVPERALTLFADVKEGEQLVLMRSTEGALVKQSGQLTEWALGSSGLQKDKLAGALLVYCAGCMLTIQKQVPDMLGDFQRVVGQTPYLSVFTFGEQGCVMPQRAEHGNLMTSVLLLGNA
ncbi:FIST C-terminal domain-containing protein [Pyxidicoccus parkwayensis]|uniref:FIST C-terminal domain-containing protein n=1 Tax=Pyxidicoccus parkwayensis TaxID=2813578 RepID=A0ABX7NVF9_9BACT|nr:FIST N-terminal domain-containing protein [Pyxidicoccus parkwaysis]QSQ22907.1 FIST C-terminal domain-containing protein [Pyxidicoccus parkwaysis]